MSDLCVAVPEAAPGLAATIIPAILVLLQRLAVVGGPGARLARRTQVLAYGVLDRLVTIGQGQGSFGGLAEVLATLSISTDPSRSRDIIPAVLGVRSTARPPVPPSAAMPAFGTSPIPNSVEHTNRGVGSLENPSPANSSADARVVLQLTSPETRMAPTQSTASAAPGDTAGTDGVITDAAPAIAPSREEPVPTPPIAPTGPAPEWTGTIAVSAQGSPMAVKPQADLATPARAASMEVDEGDVSDGSDGPMPTIHLGSDDDYDAV